METYHAPYIVGKGNSDMDEEDLLRNGNQLLKMPTLVVRQNEHTITTTQHRINHDSGLLMKPKLELENKPLWGGSKLQPRMDSSDFLSKTSFASSLSSKLSSNGGGFGSKLTPPSGTFSSPSHSGSFTSGMLNGNALNLSNTDIKPGTFQQALSAVPPYSSPNVLPYSATTMSNSKPSMLNHCTSSSMAFSAKPSLSGGFLQNRPLNGSSVFKTPALFNKAVSMVKFGAQTGFGQPTGFGNKSSQAAGLFGSSATLSFGQKPHSPGSVSFGVKKFGMQPSLLNKMFGGSSVSMQSRNGELLQPVFGTKEKVRNMVATKDEKEKQASAFEQYAGSTGETTSNPFADAMRKAKNPSPKHRTDSDILDETSSSYYSETDDSDESGELSGFTDEEITGVPSVDEGLEISDISPPLSSAVASAVESEFTHNVVPHYLVNHTPKHLALSEDEHSIPGEIGSTPLQPWTSPFVHPYKSPLKHILSPRKSHASPTLNHTNSEVPGVADPPLWQETPLPNNIEEEHVSSSANRKNKRTKVSSRTPSVPSSPTITSLDQQIASPPYSKRSKICDINSDNIVESLAPRTRRRGSRSSSIISPVHPPGKPLNHVGSASTTATPQHNGDIIMESKPLNEVSGHIDLDTPAMSLSIPMLLLKQATPQTPAQKKKTKTRAPSGRTRRSSLRTPNPYASTPAYTPATPAYPTQTPAQSPVHPSATPSYAQTPAPYMVPPTPSYPPVPPTPVHPSQATMHSSPAPPAPPAPSHPPALQNTTNTYNPKLHAPTKQEMMERMMKNKVLVPPVKKSKKTRLGPKCFKKRVGLKILSDSESEKPIDKSLFRKSEFLPTQSARTERFAPYQARFKQDQLYLCYLRRRALDLIVSLFPNIRCGGTLSEETDDVEGLIDYLITCLENQDGPLRCMDSLHSAREELEVRLCPASKIIIRRLQCKLCKLLKLMLPSLSLQMIDNEGIQTLPRLIHKVIMENNVT